MTRLVGIVVHNWPLKLGAVALATVLYAGLVVSQNVRVRLGPIPIERSGQAADVYVAAITPDSVSQVRYFAPADVASRITNASFRATIDLSGVRPAPGGASVSVPVTVEPVVGAEAGLQVTGWSPSTVSVRLEEVIDKTVRIRVEAGKPPEGLTATPPVLDRTTAIVRGPASAVQKVDAAVARVTIDASGIDVDEDVELIPVDARGDPVSPVNLDPRTVHVRIRVGQQLTTRTVPVVPIVSGSPASGYAVASITVEPIAVTVSGERDVLETLERIETVPLSIADRSSDVDETVGLAPPEGVVVEGEPTVHIRIDIVAETGSRTFVAAVVLDGTGDDLIYGLTGGSVGVTLGGPLAALTAVDPTTLRAHADVRGLAPGTHEIALTVPVPAGLDLLAVSPVRITITIVAVATPTPEPTPTPTPAPTPTPGP